MRRSPSEQPDEALAILGEHLPAALNHVLLQADLTAVAPGYLDPELSEKLLMMADAEGQGPATIYRFSVASVRRALDAGQDAGALLDFLREHSATAVPQPLQYLIEDTAARHGRLRVGAAASFIQSDDETALLELLNDPGASGLGLVRIAPTVLVSHAAPREAAAAAAQPGPVPRGGGVGAAASGCGRSTAAPGSARPVYTAPRNGPGGRRRRRPACGAARRRIRLRRPQRRAAEPPRCPAARPRPSWAWRPCRRPSGSSSAWS